MFCNCWGGQICSGCNGTRTWDHHATDSATTRHPDQWSCDLQSWTLSDRATDSATMRHPVIQWFAGHHLGHCLTALPTRPPHATQTSDLVICNLGHCLTALPTRPPCVTQWSSDSLVTTLDIVWPHYRLGHHTSPRPVILWFAILDIVWPRYRLGHHASPSDPVIRWSPPWTLSDRTTDSATTRHPDQWSCDLQSRTLSDRATNSATMRHPVIQWFVGHHLGHCPWDPPVSGTYTGDVTLDDLQGSVWIRRISRVSRKDTSTVRVFPPGHFYGPFSPAWTPLQPLIPNT